MNKLEFCKTMKACGAEMNDSYYQMKDLGLLFFSQDGNYGVSSIKVLGKIPYDFIVDFCKKYSISNKITDVVDMEYEKACQKIDNILSYDLFIQQQLLEKEKLDKRENDNKYVSSFIIDDMKILLHFILEMKDYLLRKKNMPEMESAQYNELFVKIRNELLKQSLIPVHCWMQFDNQNRNVYTSVLEKKSDDETRLSISAFDNSIFEAMKSRTSQNIGFFIKNWDNGQRRNCGSIRLVFPNDDELTYQRNKDGFYFSLLVNKEFCVSHQFENGKEFVRINDLEKRQLLTFDINNCIVYDNNDNIPFSFIPGFLRWVIDYINNLSEDVVERPNPLVKK